MFTEKAIVVSAILVVYIAIFLMLKCSHFIVRLLGASGINAISRIIGFIVIAIGVEYVSASVITVMSSVTS